MAAIYRRIQVLITLDPYTLTLIDRFKTNSRGKFLDKVVGNWAQKCDNSDAFVTADVLRLQEKVEKLSQIVQEKQTIIHNLEAIHGVFYENPGMDSGKKAEKPADGS